jgi:pimeloyl-ACP methyl ester carboxylesterase
MRESCLAALVLFLAGCGGGEGSSAEFVETQELGDRTAVTVRFESRGAKLAGTLSLPSGDGPHPALVWVHGSGPDTRDATAPFFTGMLERRFAVFAYDKRGAGESEGVCCPLDFDLLADDVLAAVDALRSREEIDDDEIGLLALSQGGWIAPLAATKSKRVRFAVILSGPAVSVGEEDLYSGLAGDSDRGCTPDNPPAFISRLVREQRPSRFDPRPVLARLDIPVLWVFGRQDLSQPVEKDLLVLRPLQQAGKKFDIVVFPNVGHDLVTPCRGDAPDLAGAMNDWLREHVP